MESITLEYPLKTGSRNAIWDMLSTPGGLEAWMADGVKQTDNRFLFRWDDEEREAELVGRRIGTYVRYHWLDEEDGTFFELRIGYSELTRDYSLVIREETNEGPDDLEQFWNASVEQLCKLI